MRELEKEEKEEVLLQNGIGVLSLVNGDQPYGIPMSFGYGNDEVSFMMQASETAESRKISILESNPNACLTVFDHDPGPPQTWRSVVIRGPIFEIDEEDEDTAFFNLADNAEFAPDFNVLGIPVDEIDLRYFGLSIEQSSGREYSPMELYS